MVTAENGIEIIAEGRVNFITLTPDPRDVFFLEANGSKTVSIKFSGPRFFLVVYDHRKKSLDNYKRSVGEFIKRFSEDVPCLCGIRKKDNKTYCVLSDIGTHDMQDGGPSQSYMLTRAGQYDKSDYRMLSGALHLDTKICLVEAR